MEPSLLGYPPGAFDALVKQFWGLFGGYGGVLYAGLLIFARAVTYLHFAPIFNRKDFPMLIKVITALTFTVILVWIVPYDRHAFSVNHTNGLFVLQVLMNVLVGAAMGFLIDLVMQAAFMAGVLLSTQMGLQMAQTMDPSQRRQTAIMETLTIYLTVLIFMEMGGFHLLLKTFKHSFDVLPLFTVNMPLFKVINIETFITLSGNVLMVATQLMASIMVFTMAFDIILALVNRTAQQVPVYQLGMALKPLFTMALFVMILHMFNNALTSYLARHQTLF